jgi:hypothetical protein
MNATRVPMTVYRVGIAVAALCGAAYLPAAHSQSLTRGPYLQMGTPTTQVVRWRTDVATDSRVRLGASPGAGCRRVDERPQHLRQRFGTGRERQSADPRVGSDDMCFAFENFSGLQLGAKTHVLTRRRQYSTPKCHHRPELLDSAREVTGNLREGDEHQVANGMSLESIAVDEAVLE